MVTCFMTYYWLCTMILKIASDVYDFCGTPGFEKDGFALLFEVHLHKDNKCTHRVQHASNHAVIDQCSI